MSRAHRGFNCAWLAGPRCPLASIWSSKSPLRVTAQRVLHDPHSPLHFRGVVAARGRLFYSHPCRKLCTLHGKVTQVDHYAQCAGCTQQLWVCDAKKKGEHGERTHRKGTRWLVLRVFLGHTQADIGRNGSILSSERPQTTGRNSVTTEASFSWRSDKAALDKMVSEKQHQSKKSHRQNNFWRNGIRQTNRR